MVLGGTYFSFISMEVHLKSDSRFLKCIEMGWNFHAFNLCNIYQQAIQK